MAPSHAASSTLRRSLLIGHLVVLLLLQRDVRRLRRAQQFPSGAAARSVSVSPVTAGSLTAAARLPAAFRVRSAATSRIVSAARALLDCCSPDRPGVRGCAALPGLPVMVPIVLFGDVLSLGSGTAWCSSSCRSGSRKRSGASPASSARLAASADSSCRRCSARPAPPPARSPPASSVLTVLAAGAVLLLRALMATADGWRGSWRDAEVEADAASGTRPPTWPRADAVARRAPRTAAGRTSASCYEACRATKACISCCDRLGILQRHQMIRAGDDGGLGARQEPNGLRRDLRGQRTEQRAVFAFGDERRLLDAARLGISEREFQDGRHFVAKEERRLPHGPIEPGGAEASQRARRGSPHRTRRA